MTAQVAEHVGVYDLGPGKTPIGELVKDTWRSRDLVRALARKNFFVRYRRAALGIAWAGILPLIQVTAMTIAFSYFIKGVRPGRTSSYAVFIAAGLLGWNYFSTTLGSASTAIVDGAGMASRIYFPRAVLPIVQVVAGLYGFTINLVVLVGMTLVFGVGISWHIILLPLAILLMVTLSTSFILVTSAVHVYFRDLRYVVAAALSAWFYVTPVIYDIKIAPAQARPLVLLNPATGVVELFRATFVGASEWTGVAIAITCGWIVVALSLAVVLHARFDRNFADRL